MFNIFKNFRRMKNLNYQKEHYRGALKQLMKIRGLRTISLANYYNWKGVQNNENVHSLKINLMNGYLDLYDYRVTPKNKVLCGNALDDVPLSTYKAVYDTVDEIINTEQTIPTKIRRNILVGINR